jgi:hypothetical protein
MSDRREQKKEKKRRQKRKNQVATAIGQVLDMFEQ